MLKCCGGTGTPWSRTALDVHVGAVGVHVYQTVLIFPPGVAHRNGMRPTHDLDRPQQRLVVKFQLCYRSCRRGNVPIRRPPDPTHPPPHAIPPHPIHCIPCLTLLLLLLRPPHPKNAAMSLPRRGRAVNRKLPQCCPLAVNPEQPKDALYALQGPLPFSAFMRDARRQAVAHLAEGLGGDALAAEYVLLALLSRAYVRTEVGVFVVVNANIDSRGIRIECAGI